MPAIMPDVKRTVRLPEGVTALEKVNAATSALLTDSDRRVCNEARNMHATFKAVPVRLAGVGVLGIHGTSAKPECAFWKPCLSNPVDGYLDIFTLCTCVCIRNDDDHHHQHFQSSS
jgi:hypothetical protein